MLRGEFPSAGDRETEALRAAYDDVLATTVTEVGAEPVAERTGVDEERLNALLAGKSPDLSLTEAASVLATAPDRPDAETIAAEARDILLMGMVTAVLDVDAVSSGIEGVLEPKEIQQKVEGRFPMNLDEYALLHSFIEGRKP
jgi:hypothetical protein